MNHGTTYAIAKAAITDRLAGRPGLSAVAVSYAPPANPLNVRGPTGQGDAIWIADAEGTDDNVVMCGAGRLTIDEDYTLTLVLQALPTDTDQDQRNTDARVARMLGEVLMQTAEDPSWGLMSDDDDSNIARLEITRGSWRMFVGPVTNATTYPSRCEFDLNVVARLAFVAPTP